MTTYIYAAYGANTNIEDMSCRCAGAFPINLHPKLSVGIIRDYRLVFRGVADLEPAPGASVEVAVWLIDDDALEALDFFEGYPSLYRREMLDVELATGDVVSAIVYLMNRDGYGTPSPYYVDGISIGYDSFGICQTQLFNAIHGACLGELSATINNRFGDLHDAA